MRQSLAGMMHDDDALEYALGDAENFLNDAQFKSGKGCPTCAHTGYRGRFSIHEVMLVDETLCTLISDQSSADLIRQHLKKRGFQSLIQDGIRKAAAGWTSISEVMRVGWSE